MEMGARCAGDEVGGRSCWWRREWCLVVLATRRWALVVLATRGWGVMLAMSASMPRAMDARAGDVLILLGEAWAGCRSFNRGGGLGELPIIYRGRGLGRLPILFREPILYRGMVWYCIFLTLV